MTVHTTIRMHVDIILGSFLFFSITVLIECYPERRFLVSSPDKQRLFCFPPITYCHLHCTNGYINTPNGCPVCQCRSASQGVTASSIPLRPQAPQSYVPNSQSSGSLSSGPFTSGSLTSGYNMFTNPCQPQHMFCSLTCPHGFLTGNNGCHFCFCASAPQAGTIAPLTTTSGPLSNLDNPCVASQQHCGLVCKYGYLKGPSNCNYCLCAPPGLVYTFNTTVSLTSTIPTTSPTPSGVILPDPCIPNQPICAMTCANGFVKGPQDCQYCLCAPSTTVTTTTISITTNRTAQAKPPSHDSHKNSSMTSLPVPSTVSPDVANECIIATTICQLKCSGGFMTDPQHCTFCVCKDEMYNKTGIPKSDEPMILLQNPCVEGMDTCRIFCMAGYLRGPKNCQYCACRH
ncbi:keratin-associated protein 16-1-like isoform X2 [Pecten maximus]|uniref:keratin-associated protein 16-1-like isoform X2 n=1 Tax=Pecten maximus TaxID=6579 RepID=UPI0014590CD9|nr:keratin-associated protein 16-1-like isoform X2 [Pecten maximus]